MKVSEAMTRDVRVANPAETIRQAAQTMAQLDAGVLPVGENDRLVGMITDRDIAVRAVAAGKAPDTPIRDIMSSDVCYCFDDQDINDVAINMADIQVRRLPWSIATSGSWAFSPSATSPRRAARTGLRPRRSAVSPSPAASTRSPAAEWRGRRARWPASVPKRATPPRRRPPRCRRLKARARRSSPS